MLRVLWILLLLPLVELGLTVFLYNRFGTPFLGWLAFGALGGLLLIARAKAGLRAAIGAMQAGNMQVFGGSLWHLLASARAFFAGVLFLFPGVISDVVALVILFMPGKVIKQATGRMTPQAANDDVIEAEFHEVREPRQGLEDRH